MRKRVYVNGISRAAPGLDLLGYLLGVWWGKNKGEAGIVECVRQGVQKLGDSVGETNWGRTRGPNSG
jgi:hypothetical protein